MLLVESPSDFPELARFDEHPSMSSVGESYDHLVYSAKPFARDVTEVVLTAPAAAAFDRPVVVTVSFADDSVLLLDSNNYVIVVGEPVLQGVYRDANAASGTECETGMQT